MMTDVSISLPAKRRRGRPRKDANLSRQESLHSPENPTHINNTRRATLTYPTPDAIKNNTQLLDTNTKDATTIDGMVGTTIRGVIEGAFDAGYLISVRIANNDTPFRGVVFQPKKVAPLTATNDIAPQARMYQRREITIPFPKNISPFSNGFSPQRPQKVAVQSVPTSKQTVFRPVLPLSITPYFSNESAFMFPNLDGKINIPRSPMVGANQQPPSVRPTDEVVKAFEVSAASSGSKLSANQKFQVHGKFSGPALGPGLFTHQNSTEDACGHEYDIQQGEMIRILELQEIQHQDVKTDLQPDSMYYNEMGGPNVNFHQDFFTDQSQSNSTRLGPEFYQSDLVDSISKSPNLKLDLSSSGHEKSSENHPHTNYSIYNGMKSPNTGYHHALVSGNPLFLPREYTRQETSKEAVGSPSGPHRLELATPQSTVNTRHVERTDSSAGCITDMDFVLSDVAQPTERHEYQEDFFEAKCR
ncbi:hypothetical protein OROMI_022465 [Orobanche minor]